MNISDTTDYKTVDVSFKIHSLLPLKKMTTTLESETIEFKKEKGVYHAVLTNNGTLEIYALSLNGMQAQDIEHIAVLDDTAPSFDEDSAVMENGKLTVTLDDSISGVNYNSIYATDDAGTKVLPESCDQETGEITFKLEEGSLTVYVEDMAGNPNQATFSINQSGIDTEDRESKFPTDGENGMNGTAATEAETKSTSAAKSTTAAAKSTSAAAKSTTAAAKSTSAAAKSTTAAAKSTTAAAKSTSAAAKSTTAAAKSTSAAAKSTTAAAKSTSAAAKSTTAAAKSTSAAAKSTTAAAKSTTAAAKSTSAAAEPSTEQAPATIAPLTN